MDYAISAVRNTCFAILSAIESDLRNIVADAALKNGDLDILPDDVRLVASQRFALDNREHPEVTPENDIDLLAYTDFADLSKMIKSRLRLLSAEYGCNPEMVASEIERMAQARNRVCHSRPLDEDDLPNFLDLAKLLLDKFKSLPWNELRRFQDLQQKDPTFVLRLQIPAFWQAGSKSTPHNIPYPDFDETGFLGRFSERKDLRKYILGPHPVITVVGEGGVGKTALAVKCLYEILDLGDDCPFDAIVWLSLKTKSLTASGVAEIRDSISTTLGLMQEAANQIGVPAKTEDLRTLTDELLEYMTEFRILLVIDNFETLAASSLRTLLSSVPRGSKVLITSRIGLGELEVRYKLDPLDLKTSVSLARRFAKSLNLDVLAKASDDRLARYTSSLYRNPLLIKWFVQSVAAGAEPDKIIAKRGPEFESALRFCFENLFSRLPQDEREILAFLSAARRPLTYTELTFLLPQVRPIPQDKLDASLASLHSSSMLRRMPSDPRLQNGVSQIALTDVAADYLSRFARPDQTMFDRVQHALKKMREVIELSAVRQAIYKWDLYAIRANTRDERICAAYLSNALDFLKIGNLEKAGAQVAKAKDLLPTFAEAYRISALVDGRKGDLYKAEEELKIALEYDPSSSISRYQYALFLLESMQDTHRALSELEPALRLEPADETLLTLKALILTRLGQCSEAATIYEHVLQSIDLRPRKWRISTRDQAAECFRRLAEQDRVMKDGALSKEHLDRARRILEEGLAADDFDSRMAVLYTNIFEDSMFFAIQIKNAQYAEAQIETLSNALHLLGRVNLRRLSIERIAQCFGSDSAVVAKAANLNGVSWVPSREEAGAPSGQKPEAPRLMGSIKALPLGVLYGFIIDHSGVDWFVHRGLLRDPAKWSSLRVGTRVSFTGALDHLGRNRATEVDLL
jgi:LuxR family transcriptional regulator, glucitol operon activator